MIGSSSFSSLKEKAQTVRFTIRRAFLWLISELASSSILSKSEHKSSWSDARASFTWIGRAKCARKLGAMIRSH